MANLVIKPASGSGNKVVFQNQAGNVDAITVEDSGAIALGTVTAGTVGSAVSLTSATFPSGHIIQYATPTSGSAETSVSSQNTFTDTVVACSITPTYSDSNILITSTYTAYMYNSSGDAGYSLRWKKTVGSVDTYPQSIGLQEAGYTNTHAQGYYNPTGGRTEDVDERCVIVVDSNVGTTSQVTYTCQVACYNVSNFQFGGTYGANWKVNLFEMKG